MIPNIATRSILKTGCRQFSATPALSFKFKLTEEMSKQFEEKQAKERSMIKEPEKALHTLESSLVMGRVSSESYKNIVKCAIPKHRFNEFLSMYRRENDDVQALDGNMITNPGDWVLLRRDESLPDKNVRHVVEKVVYQCGKYVDPITNRRSLGLYFEDDWEQLERIKLDM